MGGRPDALAPSTDHRPGTARRGRLRPRPAIAVRVRRRPGRVRQDELRLPRRAGRENDVGAVRRRTPDERRRGLGRAALFGKASRWVDYSGPVAPGKVEGICYMDHPENPHHPTHWHVRRDGWMEAAFNLASPHGVAADHPLDLRYRLLVHAGPAEPAALDRAWDEFAARLRIVSPPPEARRSRPSSKALSRVRPRFLLRATIAPLFRGECVRCWCPARSSKPVRGRESGSWSDSHALPIHYNLYLKRFDK